MPAALRNSVMECVQIEHRTYKHDYRENNHYASYHFIDKKNSTVIKFITNFIYKPRQSEPPQQGSADYAGISHTHLHRVLWYYESELGKRCHKQQDDKRIGERYQKGRNAVMNKRTFLAPAYMYLLCRV